MYRLAMILAVGALLLAVLASGRDGPPTDYRAHCLERVKILTGEQQGSQGAGLDDCVRDDITTGEVDMQSMGFAALSDDPGGNVQKLIDAGFPAMTGQGALVIGTLNRMFIERKLSGEAYLAASEPLIRAGAFVAFGNGPVDVLSELLRSAPEPETVCGYAGIVGGFDVFEDRDLPRGLAASNPAFGPEERAVLSACGL